MIPWFELPAQATPEDYLAYAEKELQTARSYRDVGMVESSARRAARARDAVRAARGRPRPFGPACEAKQVGAIFPRSMAA